MASFSLEAESNWDWTMMIMQPTEATSELIEKTTHEVAQKKPLPTPPSFTCSATEGASAQILHLGPYADEGPHDRTAARLHPRARVREALQANLRNASG
jgi:hypothetical protein